MHNERRNLKKSVRRYNSKRAAATPSPGRWDGRHSLSLGAARPLAPAGQPQGSSVSGKLNIGMGSKCQVSATRMSPPRNQELCSPRPCVENCHPSPRGGLSRAPTSAPTPEITCSCPITWDRYQASANKPPTPGQEPRNTASDWKTWEIHTQLDPIPSSASGTVLGSHGNQVWQSNSTVTKLGRAVTTARSTWEPGAWGLFVCFCPVAALNEGEGPSLPPEGPRK